LFWRKVTCLGVKYLDLEEIKKLRRKIKGFGGKKLA
jgi:hypothetical protein